MEKTPLFSVLIANYNNGKFLQEAIDSVLAQTYNNWEIIIVDDKSTDNSAEIYNKYKDDSRFHIYFNDKNEGCGYTKRRCAELAQGDICGFLDPDDTLMPNALETMVKAHIDNRNVSLIYSRYNIITADGSVIGISNQQEDMPEGGSFLEGQGGISHFVSYKRNYYLKTPGIDPDYKRAVDHDLYLLLEEVGKVLFLDLVLYNYRTETGDNISLGQNGDKAFLWHLVGMVDACRRRGLPIEDVVSKDLDNYLTWNRNEARIEGIESIKKSLSYRFGNKLMKPFKFISNINSSLKHKHDK